MIAIVYGSSTENTKDAAERIAEQLRARVDVPITLIDVATIKRDLRPLLGYRALIVGCPTWNVGELQDDWADALPHLAGLELTGVPVALFGCGDQQVYPDSFQDALGIIGRALRERGATLVGRWSAAGYDFYESLGVEDGAFLGLALDHENEAELTGPRIQAWVTQLADELRHPRLPTPRARR
jgi:flavodoxin I